MPTAPPPNRPSGDPRLSAAWRPPSGVCGCWSWMAKNRSHLNLVQYLGQLGALVTVVKNDETTAQAIGEDPPPACCCRRARARRTRQRHLARLHPCARRPGVPSCGCVPGAPGDRAGVRWATSSARGASCTGATSPIVHDGAGVFSQTLSLPFEATRCRRSLLVERAEPSPPLLRAQCVDRQRARWFPGPPEVHASLDVEGVPVFTRSIRTTFGKQLTSRTR